MKVTTVINAKIAFFTALMLLISVDVFSQPKDQQALDKKATKFLNDRIEDWKNWNVPYQDGQVLHDIIVKNNYKSALEIGMSTGHSTIWIAWAMSKTGGKVIAIEIDKDRYKEALDNIKKAGLSDYVDARLADARQLTTELEGPFDFVFSDADKGWYKQYFTNVDPKLEVGGCFTAHNVSNQYGGAADFLKYIQGLTNYKTSIDGSSSSGISISYKTAEK